MELKNIFKMTKTDRYTQDGRDELAKLQETEDVKYKTGDISQKTGLQKQPDGSWAPPKKGGTAPKMGSPEYNKKYGLTKKDVATGKEVDRIYEKQQNRIKELKAKGYTDEQIENDKIYQQTKEDMRNVGKNKPAGSTETKQEYKGPTNPDHDEILQKMKSAEGYGHVKNIGDYEVYRVTSGPEKGKYKVSLKGSNEEMTMSENQAAKYLLTQKRLKERSSQTESKLESDFDDEGDSTGTNWREKVEQNPRDGYNFEKMIQHRIPTSQTDKEELKGLRSFMNEEKATYKNALISRASNLVDGNKSNGDWYPEKEQSIMKIAKAVGFDDELHKFIEEEYKGYDFGYSEDAAPRELTGDCKIRVRR